MLDSRLGKLAETLVNHSADAKPGAFFTVHATTLV